MDNFLSLAHINLEYVIEGGSDQEWPGNIYDTFENNFIKEIKQ